MVDIASVVVQADKALDALPPQEMEDNAQEFDGTPGIPAEIRRLYEASKRRVRAPEIDVDLIVGYIDGVLPNEEMRRDIQLLVENDPKWRKAHEELAEIARQLDSRKSTGGAVDEQ